MDSNHFSEKPEHPHKDAGEASAQTREQACEQFHSDETYQDAEEMTSICSDIRGQLARMVALIGDDKTSTIDVPVRRPTNPNMEKNEEPTLVTKTSMNK
ncbi:hypothetical protein PpBr36_02728 [Pyricularia pennisetigena]|uniref:hypothetical protein n=1 Tax=Pyricularia pennisetigena TaxID=1578925 RepID=UPI0011519B6C|nr:hypothetical protein PpBr36_02728 [Pyricularia pennisetigena]TLS31509.1 hypothetical protein PpBr36_02728 [Pyricularia pennisetigena]